MKKEKMRQTQNSQKSCDLIYQFKLIDAVDVQQMLIALYRGYDVVDISSNAGVVEFRLSKDIQND